MYGFETLDAKACWEKYGWGSEAKPNSKVQHGMFEVFIDVMRDEYSVNGKPQYGCEIFNGDGDMVGQWFDESYELAAVGAIVDMIESAKHYSMSDQKKAIKSVMNAIREGK